MQSAARVVEFCGARAQVACVILAQAAVRFLVILSLPVQNKTVQSFSRAKNSSPGRFLFMIATLCGKYSKGIKTKMEKGTPFKRYITKQSNKHQN